MNREERQACDGLDDASIMETMAWLKEQCDLLQFELESASEIVGADKGGGKTPLPFGGSEQ
jgi:hypothetical protein